MAAPPSGTVELSCPQGSPEAGENQETAEVETTKDAVLVKRPRGCQDSVHRVR